MAKDNSETDTLAEPAGALSSPPCQTALAPALARWSKMRKCSERQCPSAAGVETKLQFKKAPATKRRRSLFETGYDTLYPFRRTMVRK
jgi:hypothetical protein